MFEAGSHLWRTSKFNCPAQEGSHAGGFPVSPRILYNLFEQWGINQQTVRSFFFCKTRNSVFFKCVPVSSFPYIEHLIHPFSFPSSSYIYWYDANVKELLKMWQFWLSAGVKYRKKPHSIADLLKNNKTKHFPHNDFIFSITYYKTNLNN